MNQNLRYLFQKESILPIFQKDFFGVFEVFIKVGRQFFRESIINGYNIGFKIIEQAGAIQVHGTDRCPCIVYDDCFAMNHISFV